MRHPHGAHVVLPPAPRPQRPVVFFNPRSGGGKAVRFEIAAEAMRRGIEPVELLPGENMALLVRDAVSRGADALAMAGGDGSQAVVASIAAEHSLPYACVPAGTRNHFALDLGVDPNAGAAGHGLKRNAFAFLSERGSGREKKLVPVALRIGA